MNQMDILHIRRLIANADIKGAFSALNESEFEISEEQKDYLLQIESRFNALEIKDILGITDLSTDLIEKNKVTHDLTRLLNKISEAKHEDKFQSKPKDHVSASTNSGIAQQIYENCKNTFSFFLHVDKEIRNILIKGDYDDTEFASQIESYEKKILSLIKAVDVISSTKTNFFTYKEIIDFKIFLRENMQLQDIDNLLIYMPEFEKLLDSLKGRKLKKLLYLLIIGLLIYLSFQI